MPRRHGLISAIPGSPLNLTMVGRTEYLFINAEAATFVAAMTVQPPEARKAVLDTYVGALIAGGVWSKLDAIYPFAAHTSQAGLLNAKNPGTFNATLTNAPTFTVDRGFTTNGTTSFIDSNFNPATAGGNFTQDSASVGVRSRSSGATSAGIVGWFDGTDGITVLLRNSADDPAFRMNQAANSARTMTLATGAYLAVANRSASNATQYYRDGVADTIDVNANQTSTALNSHNLQFGSTTASSFMAVQFASGYIGSSLTSGEVAALAAADLAYMQALGAA